MLSEGVAQKVISNMAHPKYLLWSRISKEWIELNILSGEVFQDPIEPLSLFKLLYFNRN